MRSRELRVSRNLIAAFLLAVSSAFSQDVSSPRVYPQPFNLTGQYPEVKIQPVPAGARVTFYSPDRRKVAEARVSGDKAFWDGRSSRGRRVSPGVYFFVVEEAGRLVASGRLYIKQD